LFANVGKSKDATFSTQHEEDERYLQVIPEMEEQLDLQPFLKAN
jgi:hypothetical protein